MITGYKIICSSSLSTEQGFLCLTGSTMEEKGKCFTLRSESLHEHWEQSDRNKLDNILERRMKEIYVICCGVVYIPLYNVHRSFPLSESGEGRDLLKAGNRRNDYSRQNLFWSLFVHASIVLSQTWKTVNLPLN